MVGGCAVEVTGRCCRCSLAEDGPSPPMEEPPPVWTLQGRAREPTVAASQPAPRLPAEVAGEASCDADLQEAEQLFPRKDSS